MDWKKTLHDCTNRRTSSRLRSRNASLCDETIAAACASGWIYRFALLTALAASWNAPAIRHKAGQRHRDADADADEHESDGLQPRMPPLVYLLLRGK